MATEQMELGRERLEEKSSEAWARTLELTIAGGVREDNWSEGQLRGRCPVPEK